MKLKLPRGRLAGILGLVAAAGVASVFMGGLKSNPGPEKVAGTTIDCKTAVPHAPNGENVADYGSTHCRKAVGALEPKYFSGALKLSHRLVKNSCAVTMTNFVAHLAPGAAYCFPSVSSNGTVFAAVAADRSAATRPQLAPAYFVQRAGTYFWVFAQRNGAVVRVPAAKSSFTAKDLAIWHAGTAGWIKATKLVRTDPSPAEMNALIRAYRVYLEYLR